MGLFDRLRGDDGPRIAFLGIDGVPYSLISDHPDRFEHLHDVIERGSAGPIDSIVPPESSACWPSLTTGVNPGKTGVYGFQDREIGSYETYVPMGRDVQAPRLWDRVEQADRNATVMNVPVTAPPQRDVQRMVSGFLSRDVETAAYPASFGDRLTELRYRIDVNAKLGHESNKSSFIEDAHDTLEARQRAFREFIGKDDWDLFFGVFMTTDRINHFLFEDYERDGPNREAFLTFYETLDTYIGELLDLFGDDVTTIIASDHGFTTLEYEVNCNQWLAEQDWLSFRTEDHEQLTDISDETTAYSLIPGRFYLNLAEREPRGSVPRESYSERLDELEEVLTELESPNGKPVVERVVRGDQVFVGDHDEIAPDLVALPHDGFDLKAGFSGSNSVFDHGPRNGMHTFSDATLITDDPGVAVEDATLYDIAPTILDIMDIEFDDGGFDGTSLVA